MPNDVLRYSMPYCVKKLADGRFILLNRNYKPLGVQSDDWVEYESHESVFESRTLGRLGPKLSNKSVTWNKDGFVWLYDDVTNPSRGARFMNAYLERLRLLGKATVKSNDD